MRVESKLKISRRGFLTAAGSTGAIIALDPLVTGAKSRASEEKHSKKESVKADAELMKKVSTYIARSGQAELPPAVIQKAKHHILDTLGAIVCGSTFKGGELAKKFVQNQGGKGEALVVGSQILAPAIFAAFANGIMAHADETDDSYEKSTMHPGAPIVPAALASAEREGTNGMRFLKGVVAGYDIGCRIPQVLGLDALKNRNMSTHSIGGTYGAAVAAASVLGLNETQVRYVLDYTAQQAWGIRYWVRDVDHIEKAFVFAAGPARNGVMAAILVSTGFTGITDIFTGERNLFECFSPDAKPKLLGDGLGTRFEIMATDIKKYSVGSPIQAAVEALLLLIKKHKLTVRNVEKVVVRIRVSSVIVVNDRDMPDVNLQYLLSCALMDGELTFHASHSYERMKDPAVLEAKKLFSLVGDPSVDGRGGIVEVTTREGAQLREQVTIVPGRPEKPMTTEEMENKCSDLMKPVLGEERTRRLIQTIWNLEQVQNMRDLRPLLSA